QGNRQDPVRDRQQRYKEKQDPKRNWGPLFRKKESAYDGRAHKNQAKPGIPVPQACNGYRVKVVITSNSDRKQNQTKVLNKHTARRHAALDQRHRPIEILATSGNPQTMKNVETKRQVSNARTGQYCKAAPRMDYRVNSARERNIQHRN